MQLKEARRDMVASTQLENQAGSGMYALQRFNRRELVDGLTSRCSSP